MPLAPKRLAFFLAAALLSAPSARALIIYGTGPTDVNNTLNTTAPTSGAAAGAPWYNVVQFGANNASGVYLGNGCVLTANHVNLVGAVVINGISYVVDPNFTPLHVTEDNPATSYADDVDLKLVRILGSPPLPVVQNLPLNFSATADLAASTIIGWGKGKGTTVAGGWTWGDDTTRAERWGTNTVAGATTDGTLVSYDALYTFFNAPFPPGGTSNETQIASGDSGGGLFVKIGSVWKLSGISTLVSTLNEALYNPPDNSFFIRLATYGYMLRYENWANAKLGSSTASATADPDKDGLNNLLEYAFHTDPNAASVTALPQVGMESGYVTLTYTKLMSATDLSYVVEQSASLSPASWSAAPVTEVVVATSGVTATIKAKVAITTETQKFLRLSVTKLP